ncbi:MAG TPA: tetratricopeptide repeat protein, partial [Gammaproteobacteria bacterium]|nr:tetratricopeptide repeat protein [Gammaproteobacteria bacterium]
MTPRLLPTLACLVLCAGCSGTSPPRAAAGPRPFVNPESEIGYHVLMGELAAERGDQATAAGEYLQASKLSSDASLAGHAALLAYGTPDTAGALAAAERWQTLAPQSADAGHFVAVLRARIGDAAGSANQFQALLRGGLDKTYATAAELLEDETDAPHAMPVLQRLVEDASQSADAHYAFAHAAMHYRHFSDAVDEARRAYALDPSSDSILVLLARALANSGRRDEALAQLEPRVRASPDDLSLHLAYAALLADASRYGAARSELETVLKAHPGNADVLYTLGLLALQDKDLGVA